MKIRHEGQDTEELGPEGVVEGQGSLLQDQTRGGAEIERDLDLGGINGKIR